MGESAPLIHTSLSPVPSNGVAEWFEGEGGVRLRAALFPVEASRGSVVLSPGRTEPIEKYFEVVQDLRVRGFTVLAHDWRGQGLSQRLHRDAMRGHASGATLFLDDYGRLLDAFAARLPRPWIALGHSMGGGLAALAILEGEARFSAAVLSAPMMGVLFGQAPPAIARILSTVMTNVGLGGRYVGGRGDPLGGSFETNVLTHDRGRWERTLALLTDAPELRLGGVTWGWLAFALELSRRLRAAPPGGLDMPIAIVAAGEERLVDNIAARAFATRVKGARYVEIEEAFHELLMETDPVRGCFWAEFDRTVVDVAASGRRTA